MDWLIMDVLQSLPVDAVASDRFYITSSGHIHIDRASTAFRTVRHLLYGGYSRLAIIQRVKDLCDKIHDFIIEARQKLQTRRTTRLQTGDRHTLHAPDILTASHTLHRILGSCHDTYKSDVRSINRIHHLRIWLDHLTQTLQSILPVG